ncbi:MAG: YraN family protein [Nocardioidaceae bacterium]|nr:YraN family protein [Nocardioidaceae bacterium]NUS52116.1 YraN family protein [Nocardioidaceae bacterium]
MTSPPSSPPSSTGADRQALGAYGERYAARRLTQRGLVVLDRNWRCDAGEIDLVLRDGPVLVVCEVKTRRSTAFGSPVEAVSEEKAARLRLLAERWVEEHGLRPAEIRIDLVGVLMPWQGTPSLEHVVGVG